MEAMHTLDGLTKTYGIDIQRDADLIGGLGSFSGGPSRAWLTLETTNEFGRPSSQDAALWLTVSPETVKIIDTAVALSCGGKRDWVLVQIADGVIAKKSRLTFDQAMHLIHALSGKNLLDYAAHLFGFEGADIAD